jgi:cell division protein FtsB
MARTTSTQRGASRRTTGTATSGSGGRGASSSRSRKPAAPSRAKSAPARSRAKRPAGPIVPITVVAVLVLLVWSLYPAMRLQYQASRSLAGVEQQSAALAARNAALKAQVAALKTPEGVEKAAREALGYAKKGDHAYVVVPSAGSTAAAARGVTAASTADASGTSLWQLILDALFGTSPATAPTATDEP